MQVGYRCCGSRVAPIWCVTITEMSAEIISWEWEEKLETDKKLGSLKYHLCKWRKGLTNAVGSPGIAEWPADVYDHMFKVGLLSMVVRSPPETSGGNAQVQEKSRRGLTRDWGCSRKSNLRREGCEGEVLRISKEKTETPMGRRVLWERRVVAAGASSVSSETTTTFSLC